MPSGLDENNRCFGLQPRIGDRRIPLMKATANRLAMRFRSIFDRIIDHEKIRTAPSDRAAPSHCVIGATQCGVEPPHARGIIGKTKAGEDGAVQRVTHEISNSASEIVRQLLAIGRRDDRSIGVSS